VPLQLLQQFFLTKELTMKFKFNAVCTALVLAAVAVPSFAKDKERDDNKHDRRQISSVPEINGAGASLALALLGGMVLIARERRRNQ
jgi:hypothetical protein